MLPHYLKFAASTGRIGLLSGIQKYKPTYVNEYVNEFQNIKNIEALQTIVYKMEFGPTIKIRDKTSGRIKMKNIFMLPQYLKFATSTGRTGLSSGIHVNQYVDEFQNIKKSKTLQTIVYKKELGPTIKIQEKTSVKVCNIQFSEPIILYA